MPTPVKPEPVPAEPEPVPQLPVPQLPVPKDPILYRKETSKSIPVLDPVPPQLIPRMTQQYIRHVGPGPVPPRQLHSQRTSVSVPHIDPTIPLQEKLRKQEDEAAKKVEQALQEVAKVKEEAARATTAERGLANRAVKDAEKRVEDAQAERQRLQVQLATSEAQLTAEREKGTVSRVTIATLQEQLRNADVGVLNAICLMSKPELLPIEGGTKQIWRGWKPNALA